MSDLRYRYMSREKAGLKRPKAVRAADHNGHQCFHWSASDITERTSRQRAHDKAKEPQKPGIKWYRLWRNPATDPITRANISRKIRSYNKAKRKHNKAFESDPRVLDKLDKKAASIWRSFQASHFARNYADIGYSEGHFAHGLVIEGRGYGVHCAASGPRANYMFNSVNVMGPGDKVTSEMMNSNAIRSTTLNVGLTLDQRHGHNDYMPTACPGPSNRATFLTEAWTKFLASFRK